MSTSLRWRLRAPWLGRCAVVLVVLVFPGAEAVHAASVVVKLAATPSVAGDVGQATLIAQGGATRIVLDFSGVPRHASQPVHVYTYIYEGRCSSLPAKPVYSLNERVLVSTPSGRPGVGSRGQFQLRHSVPVRIDELLSGRFALGLRSAPADGDQLIYCAELRES